MHNQFNSEANSQAEPSLDQYLQKLAAPMPAQEQAEWREEARQHLELLIAAHEELGLSHEEAVEAALRSFGEAESIGQEVARQTATGHWQEIRNSLLCFRTPLFLPFVGLGIAAAVYAFVGGDSYRNLMAVAATILFYVCPVISGWNIGRKTEGHFPVRDLLLIPILGALLCFPESLIFSALQNHLLKADPEAGLLWVPLAVAAACCSWHWHQARRQQPRVA